MAAIKKLCVPLTFALLIASNHSVSQNEANQNSVTPVPLAGLLLSPDISLGENVSVIGYFGGNFLYLTKDHADVSDYASAITIVDRSAGAVIYQSACQGNYVKVTGELVQSASGELKLDNISVIKYADNRKDCYRREVAPEI